MWRFHASRNPTATTTTHNTVLEIAWTVVPILILVIIAIPSFRLLYYSDKAVDAAFTIKVTGNQWYWTYNYPDQGDFTVESRILPEADRVKQKPQVPRLLAVDEEMVIPKGTTVRIIGTAVGNSMHGWTVPGFGIKKTVIPGRLNEGWINVKERASTSASARRSVATITAYMPIAVRVVSKDVFDKWVEQKKKAAGLAACDRRRFRHRSRQPLSASPQERQNGHRARRRSRPSRCPRARRPPHADRLASLRLQHQPQGHRHDVPCVLDLRRPDRRHLLGDDAARAAAARRAVLQRSATARPTAICGTPSSRRTA